MLDTLARNVVKRRREILLVAVFLAVLGLYGMMNARTNYDLFSYLPEELDSVKGINILNDTFGVANSVQLIIEEAGDTEVEDLKRRLEKVAGVESVSWVTDFVDFTVPREFWQEELVQNYYGSDATILQISFKEAPSTNETKKAFKEIKEIIGEEKSHLAGAIAQNVDMEEIMEKERMYYGLAAVAFVGLVLMLTIPSIIIPFLFIVTIGLSVVYNLGLSFYLNQELSYITGVVVFSLQFAVTMDYALFLYHRFEEERSRHPDTKAMEIAIARTFKSISSASLTTIAGFLALAAMSLGFGMDMGFTLARGVFITLIAVLTILPSLLLVFDPLIKKIAHRTFIPTFEKTGEFVAKHAYVFTLIFLILFIPAIYGYANTEKNFNLSEGMPEDLPSTKAQDVLAKKFGQQETVFFIFEDNGSSTDIDSVVEKVGKVEGVEGTFGYAELVDPLIPQEFIPGDLREAFFKDGFTYYTVDLKYSDQDERMDKVLKDLKETADEYPEKVYLSGGSLLMRDLERVSLEDMGRINYISLAAIFIILLLVFRSFSIPLVLVASIELAILLNQGISAFTGSEVTFIAALAIGSIQLGSTVDYAILLTTRYEEEMRKQGNRFTAIKKAVRESSQSILVSAGTMFAATIGMVFLSTINMISGLATLISRGAVFSFLVVLLLLPAILVVAQPILERTSLRWPKEVVKK